MPFQPMAQTTQVEIRYSVNGVPVENVLHYHWNGSIQPTGAQLNTLCQDTYSTIASKIMLMSHTGVVMREVHARNMHVEIANQGNYAPTPPIAGVKTGNRHANQVGKSLTKRSGLTGRSQHGGVRFSGVDNSLVVNDDVQPAWLSLLINASLSILADRLGTYLSAAIGSKLRGLSTPMLSTAVTNMIVGSIDSRTKNP